jgi:hypothetical protein
VEWLALALLGTGLWTARRYADHRALRRGCAAELEDARRLAGEDVTVLGDQLRELDAELTRCGLDRRGLDAVTRADYAAALDAYEEAGRLVADLRGVGDVHRVVATLGEARHAIACVRARAAGQPPPVRRSACFFDARHGPSVADVEWTPVGCGTRVVPACAQDAARVRDRAASRLLTVRVGRHVVPYWDAGPGAHHVRGACPVADEGLGPTLAWVYAM